jgi:hypothetical protein
VCVLWCPCRPARFNCQLRDQGTLTSGLLALLLLLLHDSLGLAATLRDQTLMYSRIISHIESSNLGRVRRLVTDKSDIQAAMAVTLDPIAAR